MSRTGPPIRRTGPLSTGPSSVEVAANDIPSVAQAADETVEPTDGWRVAYEMGRHADFEEVYRLGWDAGVDVTTSRIAFAIENGTVPDLSAGRQYAELRALRDAGPCDDPRCGACVIRQGWLDRHGGADFPGVRPAMREAS